MSEVDVYQPAAAAQYHPVAVALAMTPDQAKALDAQVRQFTQAVLREGTDYGVIPGTTGDKVLFRPGAQKLLQVFGLAFECNRVEVEQDDEGRKHGITYKALVGRRLPDGSLSVIATCEGTADYDESKFYKSAEQVQRDAETNERRFAEKDKRPPRPTRWQGLPEYRAPWNTLMKRAQKRAIVGATIDATAAGGVFSPDWEEDDGDTATAADGGPSWYEQALERALTFSAREDGQQLWRTAAQAARDGLCTPRQATHLQNRIVQRFKLLQNVTEVVDVEDLAQRAHDAAAAEADPAPPAAPAATSPATDSSAAPPADGPSEPPEYQPGSVSEAQLTKLHTVFTTLGFDGQDREQKLAIAETITGRKPLHGPVRGRSSKNLSLNEARQLIDVLEAFADRDALIAWMATASEQEGAGR